MPFLDLRRHKKTGVVMIETVRENYCNNTEDDTTKANMVRKTQGRIGNPPDERYKEIVSGRSLKHCPVTVEDIANAHAIFSPNRSRLKGAATRHQVRFTKTMGERLKIPRDFYWLHKYVTLTADLMFVSGLPFLVTYSKGIKMTTAEYVPGRTAVELANSLLKVTKMYALRGFVVKTCYKDKEFDKMKELVGLLEVNTAAAREHVS